MGKRTAPAWGVDLRSGIQTWATHGDSQRVPSEQRSCQLWGVALWHKRDKPRNEDMYLVWMLPIVNNYSHDFSRWCGIHGYTVSGSNNSLELGANHTTSWEKLFNLATWDASMHPSGYFPATRVAHNAVGGPPGFLWCVCVCLLQPLERLCVSLEPNLTCFIMCFYANPPVGHPMSGRQHGK